VKRGQKALCKVCENEYGGTSNLKDHLVRAHLSKLRPPADQPCVNAYLSKAKCPESHAKKITEHITGMVVRDLRGRRGGISSTYELCRAWISCAICYTHC